MKKLLFLSLCLLALVSCSKPEWHRTGQGIYIYAEADDKLTLNWTGSTNGCMAEGPGCLIGLNANGEEKSRVNLDTHIGVCSSCSFFPYEGGYYLGKKKKGRPHGFGVLIEGNVLTLGTFKKGRIYSGLTEKYYVSGDTLIPSCSGILKKGKWVGSMKRYENGLLAFEGTMKNNERNGFCKEYAEGQLVFDGIYKNDLRHGKGKEYQKGQLIYDGEWKKGMRHGHGKLYDEQGFALYDGEWEKGKYDGKGKLYTDGQCLEGKFEEGRLTKTISTSVFHQVVRSTQIWLNPDSAELYESEELAAEQPIMAASEMEFVGQLNSELEAYLTEKMAPRVEKRFGFWHLLRMLCQPWFKSDIARANAAQKYFCKDVKTSDVEDWINAKISYYNRYSSSGQLHAIKLSKITDGVIVDTDTAIKVFDREAMETTDVVSGIIIDILLCVVIAFIIGFLIGLFVPVLIPYAGIVDLVMGILAIGLGIYVSVFRTTTVSLELEQQITQLVVDNYMNFINAQDIISQMLGLL